MPSPDFLALNPGYSAADMPGANRRRLKRSATGRWPRLGAERALEALGQ